jgi:DNA-binding NarL/FixJ family response regulator
MIRVLAVDDNDIILEGLVALLEHSDDIDVVGTAANGAEAIDQAGRLDPDVVLLDVRMPVTDGVTAAGSISKRSKVLMLTYADDREIVTSAIRAGAHGYLVHGNFDVWELAAAIRAVHRGESVLSPSVTGPVMAIVRGEEEAPDTGPKLTARERELMELMVSGLANRVIAERMYVSEKTVKNHINRIYTKLEVANRAEAVALWTSLSLQRSA